MVSPGGSGSPAIPALRRLKQEDRQESEANLGCTLKDSVVHCTAAVFWKVTADTELANVKPLTLQVTRVQVPARLYHSIFIH